MHCSYTFGVLLYMFSFFNRGATIDENSPLLVKNNSNRTCVDAMALCTKSGYLSISDILSLLSTSKTLKKALDKDSVWIEIAKHNFSSPNIKATDYTQSFKKLVLKRLYMDKRIQAPESKELQSLVNQRSDSVDDSIDVCGYNDYPHRGRVHNCDLMPTLALPLCGSLLGAIGTIPYFCIITKAVSCPIMTGFMFGGALSLPCISFSSIYTVIGITKACNTFAENKAKKVNKEITKLEKVITEKTQRLGSEHLKDSDLQKNRKLKNPCLKQPKIITMTP